MTITAKIIADTVHSGRRITTMQLRYPRFIHAEFMTHRVFSRNASSSRAVPIQRMIQDVIDDPAMPVAWGSNKPGMQAGEEVDPMIVERAKREWLWACKDAIQSAKRLAQDGLHKQIVNRLLEPFGHISVVCTATEWDNFFALRCHPDADPTMRALADAMRDAMGNSLPAQALVHLPYIQPHEMANLNSDKLSRISAARCARVSYLNHDGTSADISKDLALAEKLWSSRHMSPFEHQATAGEGWFANFHGWKSYRAALEGKQ